MSRDVIHHPREAWHQVPTPQLGAHSPQKLHSLRTRPGSATIQPHISPSVPCPSLAAPLSSYLALPGPGLSLISPIVLCILACTRAYSLHASPCNLNETSWLCKPLVLHYAPPDQSALAPGPSLRIILFFVVPSKGVVYVNDLNYWERQRSIRHADEGFASSKPVL